MTYAERLLLVLVARELVRQAANPVARPDTSEVSAAMRAVADEQAMRATPDGTVLAAMVPEPAGAVVERALQVLAP